MLLSILICIKGIKNFLKKARILELLYYICIVIHFNEYLFIMQNSRTMRQEAVRRLVSTREISSQEEFIGLLQEQGFEVTQATLSRDLRQLGVIKVPSVSGYSYKLQENAAKPSVHPAMSGSGAQSISISGNLAVISTSPGFAGAVALAIDNSLDCKAVMGTIAGDDTVLIILRSDAPKDDFTSAIKSFFPGILFK